MVRVGERQTRPNSQPKVMVALEAMALGDIESRMVNEDWVKGVLRDLYNEAEARRDSGEALMFRQAAALIDQLHSPEKRNPDPQTVVMIQGQLDAAYYTELNRVFKRSNWHLCQQAHWVLGELSNEADLHQPVEDDWRVWPLSDESFPDLKSAVAAWRDQIGFTCHGGNVLSCGRPATWIIAGPQTEGAETYMGITLACEAHVEQYAGPLALGSDAPHRVERHRLSELL